MSEYISLAGTIILIAIIYVCLAVLFSEIDR